MCHTLSEACRTSRRTELTFKMVFASHQLQRWHCWILEWLLLNPNWCFAIHSCINLSPFILVSIFLCGFSMNEGTTRRKLTGRCDWPSLHGFSDFGINLISVSCNVTIKILNWKVPIGISYLFKPFIRSLDSSILNTQG